MFIPIQRLLAQKLEAFSMMTSGENYMKKLSLYTTTEHLTICLCYYYSHVVRLSTLSTNNCKL